MNKLYGVNAYSASTASYTMALRCRFAPLGIDNAGGLLFRLSLG
jgi:hypothetical protein